MKALILLAALSSTDGELQNLRAKMVPYDHKPVYQHMVYSVDSLNVRNGGGGLYTMDFQPGPHHLHKNPGTNTHEFPWITTAGYDGPTVHYHYFPPGKKITYTDTTGFQYRFGLRSIDGSPRADHGDKERVIEWKYPAGTIFMEILTTQGLTFEVRTRTKTEQGTWRANVYRPYADADDLKAKLLKLGSRQAKTLAAQLDNLPRTPVHIKARHNTPTFEFKGYREDLPEIPEVLAKEILNWPFVPYSDWKSDCFAPSTKSESLSIVPKDYAGYMVKPDSKGCMQCHQHVLKHAFNLDTNRDWYGRIRGSDAIFSFSIFDERSISTGFYQQSRDPIIRTDLPIVRE